jgi:hypothetical protein
MAKKIMLNILILFCTILTVQSLAWGRSMIKGQVVDAETGVPIKNAAVQIYWSETKGIIGMTYGVDIEVGEDLTNDQGYFKIPKYSWLKGYQYDMQIYKKGYVCWKDKKIFPTYEERRGFRLKNGMVIKLERFKEEYSKAEHANFTTSVVDGENHIYDNATKSEQEFLYHKAQAERAAWEAQQKKDKLEEKAFIDCMRRTEKGKYNLDEFCGGNWSPRLKNKIIKPYKIPQSDISKAMDEFGILFEYDKQEEENHDLIFLGTLEKIYNSPSVNPNLNWVVQSRVDKIISGKYEGKSFFFRVHSPSRSGLEVGKQYKIEAKWVHDSSYTVDDLQWTERALNK